MPTIAFTVFAPAKGLFISFLDRNEHLTYIAVHRDTIERLGDEADEGTWVALLGSIFTAGNGMGEGEGFTVAGRSMSVGDIVTLEGGGTWICDSIGWRALSAAEAARFPLDGDTAPPRTFDESEFAEQYHPAYPLAGGPMVYVRRSDIGADTPPPTEVAVAGQCRVTGEFFAIEHVRVGTRRRRWRGCATAGATGAATRGRK
jgi:hypothetical protein